MAYPRKLLGEGEEIVLDLNPHWRIFLAPAAVLVLALAGLVVVVAVVQPTQPAITAAVAVPAVVGAVWFAHRYTVWRTTHFVLTTDRVIHRSGVISKAGQNIPLERINNVASSQTALERLLRVGDLVIESAGETGRQQFSDVLHPSRVENRIYAEMEAAKARDDTRAGRAGLSVADELGKLDDLRRRGVITAEEFTAQRAKLLG